MGSGWKRSIALSRGLENSGMNLVFDRLQYEVQACIVRCPAVFVPTMLTTSKFTPLYSKHWGNFSPHLVLVSILPSSVSNFHQILSEILLKIWRPRTFRWTSERRSSIVWIVNLHFEPFKLHPPYYLVIYNHDSNCPAPKCIFPLVIIYKLMCYMLIIPTYRHIQMPKLKTCHLYPSVCCLFTPWRRSTANHFFGIFCNISLKYFLLSIFSNHLHISLPTFTFHHFSHSTAFHISPHFTALHFSPPFTFHHISLPYTFHHLSHFTALHFPPPFTFHHIFPSKTFHSPPFTFNHHLSQSTPTFYISPHFTTFHISPPFTFHRLLPDVSVFQNQELIQ